MADAATANYEANDASIYCLPWLVMRNATELSILYTHGGLMMIGAARGE